MALPKGGAAAAMMPDVTSQRRLLLGAALMRDPSSAAQIFSSLGISPAHFTQLASVVGSGGVVGTGGAVGGGGPVGTGKPAVGQGAPAIDLGSTLDTAKRPRWWNVLDGNVYHPVKGQQGMPELPSTDPQDAGVAGPPPVGTGDPASGTGVPPSGQGLPPVGQGQPVVGSTPPIPLSAGGGSTLGAALSGVTPLGMQASPTPQPDVPPNPYTGDVGSPPLPQQTPAEQADTTAARDAGGGFLQPMWDWLQQGWGKVQEGLPERTGVKPDAKPATPKSDSGSGSSWLKSQIDAKTEPGSPAPPPKAAPKADKLDTNYVRQPSPEMGGNRQPNIVVPPTATARTGASTEARSTADGLAAALNQILAGVTMPPTPEPQRVSTPSLAGGHPLQAGGTQELLAKIMSGGGQVPARRVLPATLAAALGGR